MKIFLSTFGYCEVKNCPIKKVTISNTITNTYSGIRLNLFNVRFSNLKYWFNYKL